MIDNYNNFLNESGISDVNKSYKEQILNLFLREGYGLHKIDLKNKDLPLLETSIIFNKSSKWYSLFNPKNSFILNDKLNNVNFRFDIVSNDLERLKEEITHELNHCIEYYNLKINNRKEPLNHLINNALNRTKNQSKTPFVSFRYAIYFSLDSELNARIAQLYPYLMKFATIRRDILEIELKESDIWRKYQSLLGDNEKIIKNYLIDRMGLDATLKLINDFNKELKNVIDDYNKDLEKNNKSPIDFQKYKFSLKEIDLNNIDEYFEKWYKIIKSSLTKHKNKLYSIIDEVIKDNNIIMEGYIYRLDSDDFEKYENYIKNQK